MLTTGNYYASQRYNGMCEVPRTEVHVTVFEIPSASEAEPFQHACRVSDLIAEGENINWFSSEDGGEPLIYITTSGNYYVSQKIGDCESPRAIVSITFAHTVHYVKPVLSGNGDGSSWGNASDDLQAMINASSNNHYIFVAAGTYKPIRRADALETITLNNQHSDGAYEMVNDTSDDFTQGKGYLFRAPNDWISENSETGIPYSGKFIGEPSNGDISVDVYPDGYTSVGNPYPSNIDPEAFLAANPGSGNLYFWNNAQRIFNEETETWGYIGTRYLTYSSLGFNDPTHEGNAIWVGQGFIVYTTGNSVQFDNSMRVATQESFFKIDDVERHRFWLKLSGKNAQEFNQILIGYMTGATNGIDHEN